MEILLALLAMILGFLLYPAWQIVRSCRRGRRKGSIVHPIEGNASPRRPIRWISMADFQQVLERCADVVVIDLRPNGNPPFPVPTVQVLAVRTNELGEVLEWLPENRSAAFFGASGLCLLMIEGSACMQGSAPFYVLDGGCLRVEAA